MSGNVALRNKQLTDYGVVMAAAVMTIYSGTPPANADAELSGNTALATHTLAGFAAASSGSMAANAIANDTIDADGTATFCRIVAGLFTEQLAVGVSGSGAPVIVSSTGYVIGGTSQIVLMTLSRAA